jgi:LysM repeat protein
MKPFQLLAFLLVLLPLLSFAGSSSAQVGDPYALLDAVNQLRDANGLQPYQMNSALMISAQGHSNYQASQGTWSHVGVGGSDETQRAIAAGYGSGASVMCDENVAFGLNLSPQACVEAWMSDAPHLSNLLSTRYLDAGAGATTDASGRIFYTLDVCYVIGSSRSSQNPTLAPGTLPTSTPTTEPFFSVQTVTPGVDGAFIHEVQAGQSLYSIVEAYGITLDELLALNNLTQNSVLQPGDLLIIREAPPATPTLENTTTPTQLPVTPTRRPTRTSTTPPQASPTLEKTATPQVASTRAPLAVENIMEEVLPVVILVLAVAGGVLVLIGSALKRKS